MNIFLPRKYIQGSRIQGRLYKSQNRMKNKNFLFILEVL